MRYKAVRDIAPGLTPWPANPHARPRVLHGVFCLDYFGEPTSLSSRPLAKREGRGARQVGPTPLIWATLR